MAREEGDEEGQGRKFHDTVLSGKLCQAVQRLTACKGVGCLFPWDICTKTRRSVADVLRVKHPDTRIPQVGEPWCSVFKRCETVLDTVHIDL